MSAIALAATAAPVAAAAAPAAAGAAGASGLGAASLGSFGAGAGAFGTASLGGTAAAAPGIAAAPAAAGPFSALFPASGILGGAAPAGTGGGGMPNIPGLSGVPETSFVPGDAGEKSTGRLSTATPSFDPAIAFEQAKTVAGGLFGAAQLGAGVIKGRQVPDLSLTDPAQVALLEDIRAKRKSIETGAGASLGIREAEQLGATTQANIARVTGGDVGGTVSGLIKAQRATDVAKNRAIAASRTQLPALTSLGVDLTGQIAARKLGIQGLERAQKLAEATQLKTQGFGNLAASTASLELPQRPPISGQSLIKTL